jgi:hypothetical protein
MTNPPEHLSEIERNVWQAGYNQGRIESQSVIDSRNEKIRDLMFANHKELEQWRAAGLTHESIGRIVSDYLSEEISFGKLVENLRGLALVAIEKRERE